MCRNNMITESDLNLKTTPNSKDSIIEEIPDEGISLENIEKELIIKALKKTNGNQSKAARLLKIPRHVLLYRIEKFNL